MKQIELLQTLMAFVVAYDTLENGGTYPVPGLKNALSPKIRVEISELIPGIGEALTAYDAGTDMNWDAMSKGVKKYASVYAKTPGATASFVKALNAYVSYYSTSSASAKKAIEKQSAALSDPFLLNYFAPSTVDQGSVESQLQAAVRNAGGTGSALGKEQLAELKANNPEAAKQYMLLKRQMTESWKAALSSYVRGKSMTTIPFQEAIKFLAKNGYQHSMPDGFTGMIDSVGNVYSNEGQAIAGGLPSRPLFTAVKMNPAYQPGVADWIFQAIRNDGTPGNYFYTESFQKGQAKAKFEKVAAFDAEATRKKWLPRLKALNPNDLSANSPEEVSALILEILYRTSNRIGSRHGGNESGGGFGICTLLIKHFYPQTDGKTVKFIYLGKDDVKTIVAIKPTDSPDPAIAKRVCELVYAMAAREGAKSKDPLFVTRMKNGVFKAIQPGTVNEVFRACAGVPGITAHKLRTAKGTELFQEFLTALYQKRPKLNEKQLLDQMKAGATIVGKQLNHVRRSAEGETTVSPMTSLKNYIDPALVMEMFDHYGVPYPSFLEKFMVESAAQVDGIKGPDGKPLDWDNPTPAQREAFKNMTAEEYQGFCDESIEDTDAAYDVRLLRLALSEGVEGIV